MKILIWKLVPLNDLIAAAPEGKEKSRKEKGDYLGEKALTGTKKREESAYCLEHCHFLVITKKDFQEILNENSLTGPKLHLKQASDSPKQHVRRKEVLNKE
jgi:CRP-like cAMP-binding protein